MARYRGPRCKLMRREKADLGLISSRKSIEAKCKINNVPGQHGTKMAGKISDYATQLRAKQKIRRIYGILERQFRRYFAKASQLKGSTGENLIKLLESRLDNVVYRMGFGSTRAESRQLVTHRSILVNGNLVNIPSFQVKAGDVITIKEKSQQQIRIQEALSLAQQSGFPNWIEMNLKTFEGIFKTLPNIDDVGGDVNAQLVVGFYSK